MTKIRVISLGKFNKASLGETVIFYRCSPERYFVAAETVDIAPKVLEYINSNMAHFISYIKEYITENHNDVRISMSRFFEFRIFNTYANSALEIIAIKKAILSLGKPAVLLVVPDKFPEEYDVELLQSAFNPNHIFKPKKIWFVKSVLHAAFRITTAIPIMKLKRFLSGKPSKAPILFHSFVIGDMSMGYRIDPYFSDIIAELKRQKVAVNRLVSFAEMNVLTLIKSLWALDPREFIFVEADTSFAEIWHSMRLCFSIKRTGDLKIFEFDGCDLTNYLKALSVSMAYRPVNFSFDLMRKYIRKTARSYGAIIIQYEGFFFQRALFHEMRLSSPSTKCISYQFSHINYCDPSFHRIFPHMYEPDYVFASGRYCADYIVKKLGSPYGVVKAAYSLHIPQGVKYERNEKPVLCVYVSDVYADAVATRDYIVNVLNKVDGDFILRARFHPYASRKVIGLFRGVRYSEYKNVRESLYKSDCFLSAGSSTIIFSAAMTGKPVYLLSIPNVPNWYESHSLSNLKYIGRDQPIYVKFYSEKKYIDEDSGIPIGDTCREMVNLCLRSG